MSKIMEDTLTVSQVIHYHRCHRPHLLFVVSCETSISPSVNNPWTIHTQALKIKWIVWTDIQHLNHLSDSTIRGLIVSSSCLSVHWISWRSKKSSTNPEFFIANPISTTLCFVWGKGWLDWISFHRRGKKHALISSNTLMLPWAKLS